VQQVLAPVAVQVGAVVQSVHLVDAHAREALGLGFQGVDHRHRLAVGQGHDDVRPVADVVEHGIGRSGRRSGHHGHCVPGMKPAGRG
jgi:hypothetical protein